MNAVTDLADQIEQKADELLASKAAQPTPEERLAQLVGRMDMLSRAVVKNHDAQALGFDKSLKRIVSAAEVRSTYYFVMCAIVVVLAVAFGAVTYLQQKRIQNIASELASQPVAKVDTGEAKEAFAKVGDQVTAAAGNTILAVNANTDERIKAVQDEMNKQLEKLLARKPEVIIKKVYVKQKPKRRKPRPAEGNQADAPGAFVPYTGTEQKTLDVDKATGRAVLK